MIDNIRDSSDFNDPLAASTDPDRLEYWTGKMLLAANKLSPEGRACAYGPWIAAFKEVGTTEANLSEFRYIYEKVSSGSWQKRGPEWMEFALSFLECDVMMYRSGYAKRHFCDSFGKPTWLLQISCDASRSLSARSCKARVLKSFASSVGLLQSWTCPDFAFGSKTWPKAQF